VKPSASMQCHCGSGKKYKRCCRSKDQGWENFQKKLHAGEIPFSARVSSTSGAESQIVISDVSVVQGGVETVLLNEEMTISTNSVTGDKTERSAAFISIPIDGMSHGSIATSGNATVSNGDVSAKLSLYANKKKLKSGSKTGLFAIARICTQRDSGLQYFDLLFGTKGQSEEVDSEGEKTRPHIAFYPDGNGKFVRLSGHCCTLESEMSYQSNIQQIIPKRVRILSMLHKEALILGFSRNISGEIVLNEITFEKAK